MTQVAHLNHCLVHQLISPKAWAYDNHSEAPHPVVCSADRPVNSLFLGSLALLKLQDTKQSEFLLPEYHGCWARLPPVLCLYTMSKLFLSTRAERPWHSNEDVAWALYTQMLSSH